MPECITWSEWEPSLEKAVLAMRITEFQLPSVAAEGFPLPSEPWSLFPGLNRREPFREPFHCELRGKQS